MDYTPAETFQMNYNPFGISQVGLPFIISTQLPKGLVPNLSQDSINATIFQSGTPFTSEINMQSGVIYASKTTFNPAEVTNPVSGYRIGLDIKDNNVAKFIFGDINRYLIWDGNNLIVQGNNLQFDASGNVTVGNPTGQHVTLSGANNDVEFYDATGALIGSLIGNAGSMEIKATAGKNITFAPGGVFSFEMFATGDIGHVPGVTNFFTNNLLPNTGSTYNIGSASQKYDNVYANNFLACPLPTTLPALDVIRKIPDPTVNKNGHHGYRLYFGIETFPDEMKRIDDNGEKDIEVMRTVGVLVQAVRELTKEVDRLKTMLK